MKLGKLHLPTSIVYFGKKQSVGKLWCKAVFLLQTNIKFVER